RKTVGSLAASDQFETDELRRFLQMSRSIETSSIPFGGIRDESSILINPFGDQFGCLQIGSEVFGSTISMQHTRSFFIMANFINQDGASCNTYVGQIQYFIRHAVNISNHKLEHNLAFVRWYKPASNSSTRFYFGMNEEEKRLYNIELWTKDFFPISHDCIISVH
ncbi:5580_t:CDS:2, partial [Ambispora leptoticha]